jgi:hypothetical protein
MMDELLKLIEQFAATRRTGCHGTASYRDEGLDTAKGAYCMCDSTSDAFIRYAHEQGYTGRLERYDFNLDEWVEEASGSRWVPHTRNPDPTLYSRGMHDREQFNKSGWHAIVDTDYFFVDFTAKQYHTDACYPHIINHQIAAAAAAGGN